MTFPAQHPPFVLPAFEENPNTPTTSRRLIGAIDTSGSMAGQRMRSISQALHELCQGDDGLSFESFFTWTDNATVSVGSQQKIRAKSNGTCDILDASHNVVRTISPGGNTNPNCLLQKPVVDHLSGDVLLFSTDGEIGDDSLKRFSTDLQRSYSLVVCLLIGEDSMDVKKLNMSVVSPFLSSPHVCVFVSPTGCRLLTSNLPAYPSPELTTITALPIVSLKTIFTSHMVKMLPCPPGYTMIGDSYVAIESIPQFTMADFASINMPALSLRLKTQGKLNTLRNALKKLHASLSAVPDEQTDEETALVEKIMRARDEGKKEEVASLQAELRSLHMKKHEKAYLERKNRERNFKDEGKKINEWLVAIAEVESAGYSAEDLSKISSNRIRRLEVSKEPTEELDFTNALCGECSVCADEQAHLALLILEKCVTSEGKQRPADELCVNDFMVTFPLAMDALLVSPSEVCLECASSLMKRKIDLNRTPILGYLPLVDLSIGANGRIFTHRLNTLIGAGRRCYHTFKILFAALEVIGTTGWGSDPTMSKIREYLQEALLHSVKDRLGMDENGAVVPMDVAFKSLLEVKYEENLLRQPFFAAMIVLNRCQKQYPERAVTLAKKTFVRHLVEKYNGYLKNAEGRSTKRKIRADLFDAPHGVPIRESAHLTSFQKSTALEDLLDNFKYVVYLLTKGGVTIADELVTAILACVSTLGLHEKLETQLDLLLSRDPIFLSIYKEGNMPEKEKILNEVKDSLLKNPHSLDDTHKNTVPGFYTPAGPSKLLCSCGTRFDRMGDGTTTTNWEVIMANRKAHFEQIYGSYYPTVNSAHYNLHATIRNVMAKHPDATEVTRPLVIEVLAELYSRKKGNVYIAELCENVVVVMMSYFRAKARFPDIPPVVDQHDRQHSNEVLTNLELKHAQPEDYVMDTQVDPELVKPFTQAEKELFNTLY